MGCEKESFLSGSPLAAAKTFANLSGVKDRHHTDITKTYKQMLTISLIQIYILKVESSNQISVNLSNACTEVIRQAS